MYISTLCIHFTDASAVAGFANKQCANGGVKPTDSLLFTCELHVVVLLRVLLPNGAKDVTSVGDNVYDVVLPHGFTPVSLNITKINNSTRNISLTIFIESASLLNGGEIRCDDTSYNMASARCMLGKLSYRAIIISLECVLHCITVLLFQRQQRQTLGVL